MNQSVFLLTTFNVLAEPVLHLRTIFLYKCVKILEDIENFFGSKMTTRETVAFDRDLRGGGGGIDVVQNRCLAAFPRCSGVRLIFRKTRSSVSLLNRRQCFDLLPKLFAVYLISTVFLQRTKQVLVILLVKMQLTLEH